jgi:hypothetical protein
MLLSTIAFVRAETNANATIELSATPATQLIQEDTTTAEFTLTLKNVSGRKLVLRRPQGVKLAVFLGDNDQREVEGTFLFVKPAPFTTKQVILLMPDAMYHEKISADVSREPRRITFSIVDQIFQLKPGVYQARFKLLGWAGEPLLDPRGRKTSFQKVYGDALIFTGEVFSKPISITLLP